MKELLEAIVKALVDNPDAVNVVEVKGSADSLILQLSVDSSDIGKVIGRQGHVAAAIRTILNSAGRKLNIHTNLDILQ